MLGVAFFRSEPTEYVLVYKRGKLVRHGNGLSFFFWQPTTSIAVVPTSTIDAPFIFNETTSNFQAVTVQGQLTYRISDPRAIAELLNFTVNPHNKRYLSEDPDGLGPRIINIVQANTRNELQRLRLDEVLRQADSIANKVLQGVRETKILAGMGVECLSIYFTTLKPIPEIAKALEAEYREGLQRRADEAIYARRAAGVEQERKIKENELATDVALEEQRQTLVELKGANDKKEAVFTAASTRERLAAYAGIDTKILGAIALGDFAKNADKIGTLTLTPELLAALVGGLDGAATKR